jgi:hypothetical protein
LQKVGIPDVLSDGKPHTDPRRVGAEALNIRALRCGSILLNEAFDLKPTSDSLEGMSTVRLKVRDLLDGT